LSPDLFSNKRPENLHNQQTQTNTIHIGKTGNNSRKQQQETIDGNKTIFFPDITTYQLYKTQHPHTREKIFPKVIDSCYQP
jgi:hypothetical protein